MKKKTDQELISLFEEREKKFQSSKVALQEKSNLLSTCRILFFILSIIVFVYSANEGYFNVVLILFFLVPTLFGFFINFHNKIKYRLNQTKFLAEINRNEIKRISLDLSSFDQGSEFIDPKHAYTSDMNFFGRHSVFQLINRTVTQAGKGLLAEVLRTPLTTKEKITERQQAVIELSDKLDWRQEFEAFGKHHNEQEASCSFLINWIKEQTDLKYKSILKFIGYLMPTLLVISIISYFTFQSSGYFIFLGVIFNAIILFSVAKKVTNAVAKTSKTALLLKTYSSLISGVEKENFTSSLLVELKGKVDSSTTKKASLRIAELSKIVRNLEMRNNPYFTSTINVLLLWDLQWLIRLEEWKGGLKDEVEEWLSAVEEFEVLNSLAGFGFTNSELIYPEIVAHDFHIKATNINHPLISKSKRVDNYIELEGLGNTHVITGSNMSGKSTYMRTVGVNAALAMIGAPVLASSFSISPLQVFTCMHVHDSLEEETSSFYAELKRIRQLIMQLEQQKPVLYLLDELLKGTNSVDRNLGAKALIRQLHLKTASGLISTHDLELGEMEQELSGSVKNYSFNSTIVNDEIIFDYKLTDGICRSFNASKLMEKMGIELT